MQAFQFRFSVKFGAAFAAPRRTHMWERCTSCTLLFSPFLSFWVCFCSYARSASLIMPRCISLPLFVRFLLDTFVPLFCRSLLHIDFTKFLLRRSGAAVFCASDALRWQANVVAKCGIKGRNLLIMVRKTPTPTGQMNVRFAARSIDRSNACSLPIVRDWCIVLIGVGWGCVLLRTFVCSFGRCGCCTVCGCSHSECCIVSNGAEIWNGLKF